MSWGVRGLLASSLLLGLVLRLNDLGRTGLGTDEGIYAWIASLPLDTFPRFMARDSAAPLYFLILKPWQALFASDSGLRALSIILGTASVGLAFLIGRALLGTACGVAASYFMAVAPFHVWYSQFAKNTALFVLVTQVAFLALLWAARGPSRWSRWALFGLALAALLFTHGVAPFYLVALAPAFFLLADRPLKPRLKGWLGAHALAAALFLPWAGVAARQAAHVLATFWAPRPGLLTPFRTLSNLLLLREARPSLASFSGGDGIVDRIAWEAWVLPALVAAAAGAWLLGAGGKARILLALGSLFVIPVAGVWITSRLAASVYLDRALMPSLIPLPILMALPLVGVGGGESPGGSRRPPGGRALLRGAAALAVAAGVIALGLSWRFMERQTDPQWREAMAWLETRAEKGDAIVFDAHFGRILFDRYLGHRADQFGLYGLPSDLYAEEVPTMHKSILSDADLSPLAEAAASHRTIWLVLSHTEVHDPEGRAYKWCDARMTKTKRKAFVGVVLVRYASG